MSRRASTFDWVTGRLLQRARLRRRGRRGNPAPAGRHEWTPMRSASGAPSTSLSRCVRCGQKRHAYGTHVSYWYAGGTCFVAGKAGSCKGGAPALRNNLRKNPTEYIPPPPPPAQRLKDGAGPIFNTTRHFARNPDRPLTHLDSKSYGGLDNWRRRFTHGIGWVSVERDRAGAVYMAEWKPFAHLPGAPWGWTHRSRSLKDAKLWLQDQNREARRENPRRARGAPRRNPDTIRVKDGGDIYAVVGALSPGQRVLLEGRHGRRALVKRRSPSSHGYVVTMVDPKGHGHGYESGEHRDVSAIARNWLLA